MTYHLKGKDAYLTVVEAFGPTGNRFFRSFVSPTLDGVWTPLAADWTNPFAGKTNVTFADGAAWTNDISHGELVRDGYDQRLEIDPTQPAVPLSGRRPREDQRRLLADTLEDRPAARTDTMRTIGDTHSPRGRHHRSRRGGCAATPDGKRTAVRSGGAGGGGSGGSGGGSGGAPPGPGGRLPVPPGARRRARALRARPET